MPNTASIFMVRPFAFHSNPQTRNSNAFQKPESENDQDIAKLSQTEFDNMVNILKLEGVQVLVFQDPGDRNTPDSLFPNNWISFHEDGKVILYPMEAENRRQERRWDLVEELLIKNGFLVHSITDLSHFESRNHFLEGTGSMVLDREHKLAYACISSRTHKEVLDDFSSLTGYKTILFHAFDLNKKPIYHTNVLMCVGTGFVLICLDSIIDPEEKLVVQNTIKHAKKELIEISLEQMNHFVGNMLEIKNFQGESLLVLSQDAFDSLTKEQNAILSGFARLIPVPLYTIEKNGGGSARCMMAEIHLPKSN